MWAKLTQALKSKPESDIPSDVMARVYEQHPNLSVFHDSNDVQQLNTSPPSSPSKQSRRGMFKRISKPPKTIDDDMIRSSSPMIPIGLPKKFKPNFNSSQLSLGRTSESVHFSEDPRPSQDASLRRKSHDLLRKSSQDKLRSTQSAHGHGESNSHEASSLANRDSTRPSLDGSRPFLSPMDKCNSVRSILRDPRTPGTGQNVRFFSRDAYKVISPDISSAADDAEKRMDIPFLEKLQQASSTPAGKATSRPSLAQVFGPIDEVNDSPTHDTDSPPLLTLPAPPSDISTFFNFSRDHDLPPIPIDQEAQLLDDAIEITEADEGIKNPDLQTNDRASTPTTSTPNHASGKSSPSLENSTPSSLARSPSFSFGQTLFFSMANSPTDSQHSKASEHSKASSLPVDLRKCKSKDLRPATAPSGSGHGKNRSRAISEPKSRSKASPESEINDELSSQLVVYSAQAPEPDPFNAHATTYYTPQTMIPPTPPREIRHMKKNSREEDIIVTLRTQLALQSELCTQYEVDLRARDELVGLLEKRLETSEREVDKRRNVLKSLRKKVADLERTCRHLEEEVDMSRQESMERSVMDEASGAALRMLHTQIASLEREKKEAEYREESLREEVGTLEVLVKEKTDDVQRLNETLWTKDESEQVLKSDIRDAQEQIDQISFAGKDAKSLLAQTEQANEEEKERHRLVEAGWDKERAELALQLDELQREKGDLQVRLNEFSVIMQSRDSEFGVLKEELEAQWKHTEAANERVGQLEKQKTAIEGERDSLQVAVKTLEERIGELELEWTASENKRVDFENQVQELWRVRDALEKERDEFDEQLRLETEHVDTLTQVLQDQKERLAASEQDRQFALENVARLEEKVRQRDAELAESAQRIVQREVDAEQLREQMSDMKRQHAHVVDEHVRALQETAGQEGETRRHLEALIKDRAGADVAMETLRGQASQLMDEVERLRRQVQALQQESADKEVKIVQITKQRAQDQDDLHGLNIALDSKQQELELIKRKLGVKGTAGSTPAQHSKIAHRRDTSTPIVSRPVSIASDSGLSDKKSTDTPISFAKAPPLGKSVRGNVNGPQASVGSMGPPAPIKPRVSAVNTPTPLPRALSRSTSVRPSQPSTPLHNRSVSGTLEQRMKPLKSITAPTQAPSANKENVEKRNMVPMPG